MSGDHAKKDMVTDEKPATSHGKAPSGESYNKGKRKEKIPFTQVASERWQKEEDEEGGLLRDWHLIAIHLRLRHAVHHF
jgi:hypothetical protein